MTRDELVSVLATDSLLSDLRSGQIEWLEPGKRSHPCRIRVGARDLFAKEVEPHEREMLRRLSRMELRHVPRILLPRLLDAMVLVTDFVPGGAIQDLALDTDLTREMAVIQNRCSDNGQDDNKAREHCRTRVMVCFDRAAECLHALARSTPVPEFSDYERVFSAVEVGKSKVADIFAGMPFARLHHDFYPNNILTGPPQVVVDWGSSYGDGPFLYDLAPYLLLSAVNLEAFTEASDLCTKVDAAQLRDWLLCATAARFASFLKGLFDRGPGEAASVAQWSDFLSFYWPMFAVLDTDMGSHHIARPHGR